MTDAPSTREMTRSDIASGLRAAGLRAGMRVVVHSSLRSFGWVSGGGDGVASALMEVLTERGTLVMPVFNHGRAYNGPGGMYDAATTPAIIGAIPEVFRQLPGVHRSLNPTHSFAAWGASAERYVRHHHRTLTMGPDSPLGMLWREGGYVLMLGTGLHPNTFHHVVEMTLGAPCLGRRTEAMPIRLADGRVVEARTWGWRETGCRITDKDAYHEQLEIRGLVRRGRIGSCETCLMKLSDCFEVVAEALTDGIDGCPPCSRCPIRPRKVASTTESDWDPRAARLKPDSAAWGY